MSANRDKEQNVVFLFPKSEETTSKIPSSEKVYQSSRVLKVGDLNSEKNQHAQVNSYSPKVLASETESRAMGFSKVQSQKFALDTVKKNLKNLSDLQARLRFMIEELEKLSKK